MDGRLHECWRYRVKSMQGERLDALTIVPCGVEGDRGYALLDAATGRILSAKSVKDLLFARAEHVHLVTTATLAGCQAQRPDLDWDVRRFRPNLVIDVDGPPFVEND